MMDRLSCDKQVNPHTYLPLPPHTAPPPSKNMKWNLLRKKKIWKVTETSDFKLQPFGYHLLAASVGKGEEHRRLPSLERSGFSCPVPHWHVSATALKCVKSRGSNLELTNSSGVVCVSRQEEEMYQMLVGNYEERHRELVLENTELRDCLLTMQRELSSLLKQTSDLSTVQPQSQVGLWESMSLCALACSYVVP